MLESTQIITPIITKDIVVSSFVLCIFKRYAKKRATGFITIEMIFPLGVDPLPEDYIEIAEEDNDAKVTENKIDYQNDEVKFNLPFTLSR